MILYFIIWEQRILLSQAEFSGGKTSTVHTMNVGAYTPSLTAHTCLRGPSTFCSSNLGVQPRAQHANVRKGL